MPEGSTAAAIGKSHKRRYGAKKVRVRRYRAQQAQKTVARIAPKYKPKPKSKPKPKGERQRNARRIIKVGRASRASRKQLLAALATGIVESNLRNVNHGDRDSLGVFQQRPSQGWGTPKDVRNPAYAAFRFFEEAKKVDRKGLKAGDLAQDVQRSAYPGRYRQRLSEAQKLLRRLG